MIWFTADWHLFHNNILVYCNRKFNDINEMNRTIIDNYNSVVKQNDTVFILGDISLTKNADKLENIIKKFNGNKHLILGNHDRLNSFAYIEIGFLSVHTVLEVDEFILVHNPASSCTNRNKIWLCGHIHDLFKKQFNVINVGVDVWNFAPVSIDTIKYLIN